MPDPISALFQPILEAGWKDLEFIAADQLGLPTTNWGTYSPERNILTIDARMLEALHVASIEQYRGMFLGYSAGDPLTALAQETYNTPRLPATFATALGDFFNSTVNTYTVPIGDYITVKKSTTDDVTYRIDGPLSIPPGLTAGVTARANTAGSVGSAGVGDIDEIEGQVLPGVTFANSTVAVGLDIESDPALASRARLAVTALAIGGPSGAYEYFARGGERNGEIDAAIAAIGVNRVVVIADVMTGAVRAYFATSSGVVAGTSTTGDLGAINAKELLRVVPVGVAYQGASAVPKIVDIDYTVFVRTDLGVDANELKAQILADLSAFFQVALIGGYPEVVPTMGYSGSITVSKIRGFLTDVVISGEKVVHNALNTLNGNGDVLFLANEVPVLGAVTGIVTFQ